MIRFLLALPLAALLALPAQADSNGPAFTCHNDGYRTSILSVNDQSLTVTESYFEGIALLETALGQTADVDDIATIQLTIPRAALSCLTGSSFQIACTGSQSDAVLTVSFYGPEKTKDSAVTVTNISLSSILQQDPLASLNDANLAVHVGLEVQLNDQVIPLTWTTNFLPSNGGNPNSYSSCAAN